MEDKTLIAVAAMLLLALIECWALYLGIDGAMLAAVIAVFAFVLGVPSGWKLKEQRNQG